MLPNSMSQSTERDETEKGTLMKSQTNLLRKRHESVVLSNVVLFKHEQVGYIDVSMELRHSNKSNTCTVHPRLSDHVGQLFSKILAG